MERWNAGAPRSSAKSRARPEPARAARSFATGTAINSGRTQRWLSARKARRSSHRETSSLIGSDKVEGTAVYRSNGDKVGSIERIMIDKRSGKVAYAVMSFGGFLGIGEDYYPLPWSLLTYNPQLEGYEVNIAEQQLKGAPQLRQARELGLVGPRARTQGV